MDAPLNFAKDPFRNERLPGILFGILGGALVVGTLWHAVVLTRYLMREAEELDVTVQGMEERRSSLVTDINRTRAALDAERSDVMSQRVAFLADTYRQKGFSWTGLFNQLEAVIPPNIRITSISPSATEGEIEVRLTIVGRSLEDLLTLVRNLEQSRFFGTVMPLNEAQQEEEGTVSSTVTLRYHAEESEAPNDAANPEGPRSRGRRRTQPAEGAAPDANPDEPDGQGEEDLFDEEDPIDDEGAVDDEDGTEDDDLIEDNDA
ncbi:MAG: PilN domain-containing protein [Vicinamibacteria bacterium]